jgi:hypothetical protein
VKLHLVTAVLFSSAYPAGIGFVAKSSDICDHHRYVGLGVFSPFLISDFAGVFFYVLSD